MLYYQQFFPGLYKDRQPFHFADMVQPVLLAFAIFSGLFTLISAAPPFGQLIYSCTTPGVIAPAFDDGPWIYTPDILNK